MKLKHCLIWVTVMVLLCISIQACADQASPDNLLNCAEKLFFDTDNVTLEGTFTFSLDHNTAFKRAEGTYVQDGTNSLWRLKLFTPRQNGERQTGFTVIANDHSIYVMEDYTPGEYRTGYDIANDSVLRPSPYLSQLLKLAHLLSGELAPHFTENSSGEDSGTSITLSEKDMSDTMNSLLSLVWQLAVKRYFGVDYDESLYVNWDIANFTTETDAILGTTQAVRLGQLEMKVKQDELNRFVSASGSLELILDMRNNGDHVLQVLFDGKASLYGESHVDIFRPEDYGIAGPDDSSEQFVVPEAFRDGVYVNPDGGSKIHLDANCPSVPSENLPLSWRTYSENLAHFEPCEVCCGFLQQDDPEGNGEQSQESENLASLLEQAEGVSGSIINPSESDVYKSIQRAEQLLKEKYGIQPEMLTFFNRNVMWEEPDSLTYTLTGMDDFFEALGTYTVCISGDTQTVTWSHDGENTDGLFASPAWGIDQICAMVMITKSYHEVESFYPLAEQIAQAAHGTYEIPEGTLFIDSEMNAGADEILDKCHFTLSQMYEAGKKVVKEKYGLTEQQMKVIEVLQEEPASFFEIRDGKLLFQVWLNLIQNPFTTEWTDKDGTYEVIFDAETGEIRDVIYDSGLNGNG